MVKPANPEGSKEKAERPTSWSEEYMILPQHLWSRLLSFVDSTDLYRHFQFVSKWMRHLVWSMETLNLSSFDKRIDNSVLCNLLVQLRNHTSLHTLDLSNTLVNFMDKNQELDILLTLSNLKTLILDATEDANNSAEIRLPGWKFVSAAFPQLTTLSCCGRKESIVDDMPLKYFAKLTNLQHLNLRNCNGLSDLGCAFIGQSLHSLKTLDLTGKQHVTHEGIEQLQRLTNLTELSIRGRISVKSGLVSLLGALPQLNVLILNNNKLSEKALKRIRRTRKNVNVIVNK